MASTSTAHNELSDAFDEIAPSSSSKRRKKLPYDVFINHRGPDVKDTLATTIHHTLVGTGLTVFLDSQELELGDFLPREIQEAMRSASLHITIFSERYAESPWCLAELAFILKTGTPIVPVFYYVQPADLRWVANGVYAPAFSQHEWKGRYTREKLDEWKRALHEVSFYDGHIIINNEDERSLLKKIVNCVLKEIKDVPLVVAKHPVGLHETLKDFEMTTLQSAQLTQNNVQIVGICGMGGSGKTTLAKQIYNNKWASMESRSFISDIRDAASKSLLHKKQEKLLQDLGVKDVSFDSIDEGKGILARRLRSLHALLVLDDVDHADQLEALLPAKDSLGSGSFIAVTTRELEVLKSWGISSIYKMRKLDPSYAKQLFCWHAFLQPSPLDGFEEFVKKFIKLCDGLPLSIKVFGGQVYGISCTDYWQSLLHKLSRILPGDVKQSLKISYDALDDEEKGIFLDTSCFFIGEEKSLAIAVWDGCGWSGLNSWEKLVNKCLVELDERNRITIHDHLRDLGREIASQQLPHRLWFPGQIINVQNQAEKRNDIRGIIATKAGLTSEVSEGVCGLAASSLGLKIVVAEGHYFNQAIGKLVSRELVWLRCTETGHRNLPSSLSFKNLRVLELHEDRQNHLEELWKAHGDAPVQLRELVISRCLNFQRFPESIGCLKDLKKMVIYFNSNLRSLPEEFCRLQSLEHLQLTACWELSSLPSQFGDLRNLRHLDLSRCKKLRILPITFKRLTLVNYLNFQSCENLTFISDILENMTKLEHLNLSDCKELEELPRHITNQASLRELYLEQTGLKEVPGNIGELSNLRWMKIGSPLLTSLPTSLGNLSSLTELSIHKCHKLESLPDSLGHLNLLKDLSLSSSGVKYLPEPLRRLTNLQTLDIRECPISKLDFGQGSFTSLCNLNWIYIRGTEVSKISISEDCCPVLDDLTLERNRHLREIEALPTTVKKIMLGNCTMVKNIRSIGGLVNLQTVRIVNCKALDELPSFADLASLKNFVLYGCYRVLKIEGIEQCRSLEVLRVETRWKVAGIESLEHMERLKRLQLTTNKRSVVQTCIQTLQKWPSEIIICTRAACDAASLVNSFSFPNLSIVASLANQRLESGEEKWVQCPSNADAIMLCFVINCVDPSVPWWIGQVDGTHYATELEEGKWVWIGVFTQCSSWLTSNGYTISLEFRRKKKYGFIQKTLLVKGEENSILEAFQRLLTISGKD